METNVILVGNKYALAIVDGPYCSEKCAHLCTHVEKQYCFCDIFSMHGTGLLPNGGFYKRHPNCLNAKTATWSPGPPGIPAEPKKKQVKPNINLDMYEAQLITAEELHDKDEEMELNC